MILDNINNFEQTGKIIKTSYSFDQINKRYCFASSRFNNAKKLLMHNHDDEEVYISTYAELYGSFRTLCDVMLALNGYRVSESTKGHHEAAINSIWITLDDEGMNKVYSRLKKIGKKRSVMEYGGTFDISLSEIQTMINDVQLVLKRVGEEVEKNKPGQRLPLN